MNKKTKLKQPSKPKQIKVLGSCWYRDPYTHRMLWIPKGKATAKIKS